MPHPFFDRARYPWDRDDAFLLYRTLVDAISVTAQIVLLYERTAALPPLNVNQSPDLVWKEALDKLTANGALQKFVSALVEHRSPFVSSAAKAVRDAAEAEEAVLEDEVILLDRDDLRGRLDLLRPDTGRTRVVLVRGEPQSGKTWGTYLFEKAANEAGVDAVIPQGLVSVDDALVWLFGELGALDRIPPRNDSTTHAWYLVICHELRRLAEERQHPLWIAVDNLGVDEDGAPLIDPEIRAFFNQLALTLASPSFRRWFRLMLINYPDIPVPTTWNRDLWREDRTSAADVKVEHIEEWLKDWATRNGRQLLDDELGPLAKDVIARADAPRDDPADVRCRLQRIHDVVTSTVADLARRPT
jgi:hypothetical protein